MKTVTLTTTAPAAPKSQIKAMSGVTVADKAPQSALAIYVNGDIKGGAAANEYRISVITDAIREAFKGNSRALIEARQFATGKSKKARAYAAGFDAIGIPARVQYVGKLDSADNANARAAILSGTQDTAAQFDFFFNMVMDEKPAKKEKAAPAPAPAAEPAASAGDETSADDAALAVESVEVVNVMADAVRAVAGGLALLSEVEAMEEAIAQFRANMATMAASASAALSSIADEAIEAA